jgi:type IV secretory pathway ATPase VirB11/archaellum biosynthesis ATPase
MTAMDGGPRLDEGPAVNSVLERPAADAGAPRSLEEIFPLRGDANRARQMQEAWRAFSGEMTDKVRQALCRGTSPPEIAYAIGEIVHGYFRTRGITLASFELRRLVAELLAPQRPGPQDSGRQDKAPLVEFANDPSSRRTTWTGAEAVASSPAQAEAVFDAPSSGLVTVTSRDDELALLTALAAKVRARLGVDPYVLARAVVVEAIAAAIDDLRRPDGPERERLARLVLSELCGLGPIDRLWADSSVHAVFVNGPASVQVERDGAIEATAERFRDQAHLEEIAGRLAPRPVAGAAAVNLRDGSEGVVLFPPAAPEGPVVALRRGSPGEATFERLISAGRLDRRMADLLRIAVRSRLNVGIVGPARSGKSALLAAIARDMGDARLVTLAPHRMFSWPAPAKVELVTSPQTPLAAVLPAAAQLRADLMIADALSAEDAPALSDLLARGVRGIVAAGEARAMTRLARDKVDLMVRLGPAGDGLFVVASMEDGTGAELFAHRERGTFHRRGAVASFAGAVQKAGYGEALASVLG